jgi:hypothetical protein
MFIFTFLHSDMKCCKALFIFGHRHFILFFPMALAASMKLSIFISVTRSQTVGRTPWTGDQLIARPLLTSPGDCDDGEVGGMNGFGMGN